MQSVFVYGRLLARTIVAGINNYNEFPSLGTTRGRSCAKSSQRDLHLVTAYSGYSKSHSSSHVYRRCCFGDDACFVVKHRLADVIGVADGVGGWRNYGIDPSHFSRTIMRTCERLAQQGHFKPNSPEGLLEQGYNELLEQKEPISGSATACIVALYREKQSLHTANLGDSGFLVIRRGKVVHRSEEQQHYFNTPYQLSSAPASHTGQILSDSPTSADSTQFDVQEGDVIVVGTDGLFDNLSDDMICQHVHRIKPNKKESLQQTADSIATTARLLAFDPDYMSPFSEAAISNGIICTGGKPDDITVVIATVNEGEVT